MIDQNSPKTQDSESSLNGSLPPNIEVGKDTVILGDYSFKRFKSKEDPALVIGNYCTMDGVHFALGKNARVAIGDYSYFTNAILLTELHIRFGSYVVIGWNAVIMDTDFHPIAPAERIMDVIACSPASLGKKRPYLQKEPVIIEDNVWIGPNTAIFKGVHIGKGAFIEPGSVVTSNVPPRTRVMGNPARVIGEV